MFLNIIDLWQHNSYCVLWCHHALKNRERSIFVAPNVSISYYIYIQNLSFQIERFISIWFYASKKIFKKFFCISFSQEIALSKSHVEYKYWLLSLVPEVVDYRNTTVHFSEKWQKKNRRLLMIYNSFNHFLSWLSTCIMTIPLSLNLLTFFYF